MNIIQSSISKEFMVGHMMKTKMIQFNSISLFISCKDARINQDL